MTDRARPGLVTFYDIRPGNVVRLFLQPGTHTGHLTQSPSKYLARKWIESSILWCLEPAWALIIRNSQNFTSIITVNFTIRLATAISTKFSALRGRCPGSRYVPETHHIPLHNFWIHHCAAMQVSVTILSSVNPLCLCFNGHLPGEPGLAGVYWSKGWWRWWWQLDYWSYNLCSSQIITTNKPTSSFFTGRMPFLSPNQQCQITEGKISHSMDMRPSQLDTISAARYSSNVGKVRWDGATTGGRDCCTRHIFF